MRGDIGGRDDVDETRILSRDSELVDLHRLFDLYEAGSGVYVLVGMFCV